MESLTKAEEQVMQALWSIGQGFVKEVLEALPDNGQGAPAYTTVSTIIRILEHKGFVGHEAFGRAHRYRPLVSREAYSDRSMRRMVKDYFGGSAQGMMSHFLESSDLTAKELDDLLKLIQARKRNV